MAVRYPMQETSYLPDPEELIYGRQLPADEPGPFKVDSMAIAAVVLLLFLGLQLARDRLRPAEHSIVPDTATITEGEEKEISPTVPDSGLEGSPPLPIPILPNPNAIAYPYDDYWLTQGPHGFSYGHMAIDLSAGHGVPIKSPIQGTVTGNYIDQYGNTTLILENERYQVTLLHGDYNAAVGQNIKLGEVIGSESNNGYTTDMYGNSCRGRDCGYHTHLNVYDFSLGQNVNPLDILSP